MINLSSLVRRELRLRAVVLLLLSSLALSSLHAREKKDALQYGEGLIVNVPFPETEVMQAVEDVVQNGIIRGTKEYNKDEFIDGAKPANSSRAFPAWTDAGKVFYKVRTNAIDPRNFKNGGDVGTLTVRYVVQAQGDSNTVLRIDAVFVEDFRKTVHASDGSVESSEYKDIHDHLEVIELMKEQTAEAEKTKAQQYAKKQRLAAANDKTHVTAQPSSTGLQETSTDSSHPDMDPSPSQPLEQRLRDLRRQVVRVVKAPGAPLKSAPFHSASTLLSVTEGTEVLIVVSTPYWYGVETHEGQHGWIRRDQLEQAP